MTGRIGDEHTLVPNPHPSTLTIALRDDETVMEYLLEQDALDWWGIDGDWLSAVFYDDDGQIVFELAVPRDHIASVGVHAHERYDAELPQGGPAPVVGLSLAERAR